MLIHSCVVRPIGMRIMFTESRKQHCLRGRDYVAWRAATDGRSAATMHMRCNGILVPWVTKLGRMWGIFCLATYTCLA